MAPKGIGPGTAKAAAADAVKRLLASGFQPTVVDLLEPKDSSQEEGFFCGCLNTDRPSIQALQEKIGSLCSLSTRTMFLCSRCPYYNWDKRAMVNHAAKCKGLGTCAGAHTDAAWPGLIIRLMCSWISAAADNLPTCGSPRSCAFVFACSCYARGCSNADPASSRDD